MEQQRQQGEVKEEYNKDADDDGYQPGGPMMVDQDTSLCLKGSMKAEGLGLMKQANTLSRGDLFIAVPSADEIVKRKMQGFIGTSQMDLDKVLIPDKIVPSIPKEAIIAFLQATKMERQIQREQQQEEDESEDEDEELHGDDEDKPENEESDIGILAEQDEEEPPADEFDYDIANRSNGEQEPYSTEDDEEDVEFFDNRPHVAEEQENDNDIGEPAVGEHQEDFDIILNYLLQRKTKLLKSKSLPPRPQLLSELKLLKLIQKYKLPLVAFKEILNWAHEGAHSNLNFKERPRSRDEVIREMRHLVAMPYNEFKPEIISWLPDNRATTIYVRRFRDALFELLSNEEICTAANISLPHPTDPYRARPDVETNYVSELHHGTWWTDSWERICEPGQRQMLVPIILYIDGVATDDNGRLGVTPLNMTLGIFKSTVRTLKEAWTTLYYHPDNESEAAHHKNKTLPFHKLQNLHRGIEAALEDFKEVSKYGMKWELPYGDKKWPVHMHFSICFVVGDTEMHDALCGKYNCRNSNVKALCRHCDCPTDEIVNPRFIEQRCILFEPSHVDPSADEDYDDEYFKDISHHPIKNAFHPLCFGSNPHNIHLGTPGELLHMVQKGNQPRSIESFEFFVKNEWSNEHGVKTSLKQVKIRSTIEVINHLGHQYGGFLTRQSDRLFPRTKFKNSLFSTTKKAGHEHAGVVLNLLLACLSDRGRQMLLKVRTLDDRHLEDKVDLFQSVLGFEQWLKRGVYSRAEVANSWQGLSHYVGKLRDICIRDGMGSKLIKNHLVLHIPEYMRLWGTPTGWDSGPSESHHKTEVKVPAKNTQRRQATFLRQVATRYDETMVIRKADMLFGGNSSGNQRKKPPPQQLAVWLDDHPDAEDEMPPQMAEENYYHCGGSFFKIGYDANLTPAMRWEERRYSDRQVHPDVILSYCCTHVLPKMLFYGTEENTVKGFTEYKVKNSSTGTNHIYRAHPCYKSTSGQTCDIWYDWAFFKHPDKTYPEPIPGQIACLLDIGRVKDRNRDLAHGIVGNTKYAVVRLFKKPPSRIRASHLRGKDYCSIIKWGELEDELRLIPCSAITGPVAVVPNLTALEEEDEQPPQRGNKRKRKRKKKEPETDPVDPRGGYFVVSNSQQWAAFFTSIILNEAVG